jgi:hypothetical protein
MSSGDPRVHNPSVFALHFIDIEEVMVVGEIRVAVVGESKLAGFLVFRRIGATEFAEG